VSPVAPWLYVCTLPADVGRILSLSQNDQPFEYERFGNHIHMMVEPPVLLRYVKNYADADDGTTFPDDFAEALANLLASELAVPVTQNQSLRETYIGAYLERMAMARHNGAVERYEVPVVVSSWLDAHYDVNSVSEIDPRLRGLSGA